MKRKITEISVFEFFLCMFVILIHLLSEGVDTFPKWSFLSVLFYSLTRLMTFAVPAFIFTSSVKLFYKYGGAAHFPYPRFLWDRIRKICFPYFLAIVIYYLVFVYVMHLYEFDLDQLLHFLITGDISAQFYFIVLIIQFYLLMPIWIYISRVKSKLFSALMLLLALAITVFFRMHYPYTAVIHKIFPSYFVFWISGMYVGLHYEAFEKMIVQNKPVIYVAWLVLAVAHCVLSYMQFGGLIAYKLSPLIVVLFCFFSSFGFYSYARELTISLESRGKGLLTSISQASYDIYLIHCLIILVMNWLLTKMEIDNILQRFAITAIVTYFLSIVFCVLQATIYANIRSKYLRASATRARKMARRKRYL